MPDFRRLPPAFFDSTVSDAQLQELWTRGGEQELERLKQRRADLMEQLSAVNEAIADAEEFVDTARANAVRYGSRRARLTPPRTRD